MEPAFVGRLALVHGILARFKKITVTVRAETGQSYQWLPPNGTRFSCRRGVGQSLIGWMVAGFFLEVFIPMALGSYQAIWLAKTTPLLQGRVLAARNLVASIGEVIAMLVSGMLIDRVLGPAMMPGGELAGIFGGLVGTGAGAGMGLVLVLCGVLTALVGLSGYAFRRIREVETLLPDHDTEVGTVMT